MSNNDDTIIVVPGDITEIDKRRFRVIPLTYPDKLDRAGIGEALVNRDTGDFYIIDNEGIAKSRTANIEQLIHEELVNNINTLSYQYNHNRRVYRLFFSEEYVRLDTNLILDDSCAYYRVRSISDDTIYYTTVLTEINSRALLVRTMTNNEMYFVEFYNRRKEQISCLPFSAKAALYFDSNDDDGELVSYIYISTNKDFAYIGEDPASLICRIIAVYDDGREKDITEYTTVDIDVSEIDWNTAGVYTITATYVYDYERVLSLTATKSFEISADRKADISDMLVIPRKIINLNDGSREIKLTVIIYYNDGSLEDVSDECIISAFDPTLFNEDQTIVIKLNAGTVNIWEDSYVINVKDDGSASSYQLKFVKNETLEILELDDMSRGTNPYPDGTAYYRVREAQDISIFYTPTYTELYYSTIFTDDETHEIAEGKNVIVEFYDSNYNLLDADVYVCKVKAPTQ